MFKGRHKKSAVHTHRKWVRQQISLIWLKQLTVDSLNIYFLFAFHNFQFTVALFISVKDTLFERIENCMLHLRRAHWQTLFNNSIWFRKYKLSFIRICAYFVSARWWLKPKTSMHKSTGTGKYECTCFGFLINNGNKNDTRCVRAYSIN